MLWFRGGMARGTHYGVINGGKWGGGQWKKLQRSANLWKKLSMQGKWGGGQWKLEGKEADIWKKRSMQGKWGRGQWKLEGKEVNLWKKLSMQAIGRPGTE